MLPRLLRFFVIFSGVLILVVLAISIVAMSYLKKTMAFKTAVVHASNNEQILKETGGFIGIGYVVGGEWNDKSADLNFEVHGVKKDLEMYYRLEKLQNGSWEVKKFSFEDD